MNIKIRTVDFADAAQANELLELMEAYATDIMGGGESLPENVQQNLAAEMGRRPHVNSAIAYVDDKPAGLINFIEGFSTFRAQSLMNVHDVVVKPEYRGQGICRKMFEFVETEAAKRGCCKVTLEVLENNQPAIKAYQKFGYQAYQLSDDGGVAQFWQKKLD